RECDSRIEMGRLVWGLGATVTVWVLATLGLAQSKPEVRLTIDDVPLLRGRSTILTVHIDVPRNYFVPAETRGPVSGAWLQVLPPWPSPTLPTYPIPQTIRMSGSDAPILAYSGSLIVHVPIYVLPGMQGRNDVAVRFSHQLCDTRSCGRV